MFWIVNWNLKKKEWSHRWVWHHTRLEHFRSLKKYTGEKWQLFWNAIHDSLIDPFIQVKAKDFFLHLDQNSQKPIPLSMKKLGNMGCGRGNFTFLIWQKKRFVLSAKSGAFFLLDERVNHYTVPACAHMTVKKT